MFGAGGEAGKSVHQPALPALQSAVLTPALGLSAVVGRPQHGGAAVRWPGRAREGHFRPTPGPAVARGESGNEGLAGSHLTAPQHAGGQAWWPPLHQPWVNCGVGFVLSLS